MRSSPPLQSVTHHRLTRAAMPSPHCRTACAAVSMSCSHKDNTHRPTRDHAPRHASLFYYPGPVALADGPTAFVPGSQYWAVDREGLGMGEERLDPP